MLKVLHTGDWHIGSFPGPEVGGQNARFQDICRCLDFQAMYAEEHRPDLIVVSGDIFHQARVWSDRGLRESRTAIDHIRRLSNVAPTVVLRGTPNHDSEEQFEMLTTAFYGDDSVSVVTEPEVLHIHTYHGQRVDVACIPGFDRGVHRAAHPGLSREEETQVFTDELAKVVLGLKAQCEPGVTSILSTHFTVPGCNMESGQTALFAQFEPVIYPATLKAADFDLVALGHIHRPQQLPEAGRAVFYCGSITGLNFNDENQPRGFYIHDIDDDGEAWSEYVETPYREFETIRLGEDDVHAMLSAERVVVPDRLKGKIVRVLYTCSDETNKAFNKAVLEKRLYDGGVFYVSEITPEEITTSVNRDELHGDNSPEQNLAEYLTEKEKSPEDAQRIIELARPIISEAMEKGRLETPTGVFMPVEIEVKNYRNYRDELFSYDGISFATINGENGAGKSSLFMDAMLDALFEEPREGDLTGWICNDPDARSGSIKFTFYLGDKLYRVTRTRTKSGKATLNLSEYVDESWQNRSAEKYRDTQTIIENTIGMDSLTLKATGLIMQDQYGLFLQADKADRMAILGNILGLGIYDRMESMAANRAADANRELRRIADLQEETGRAMPDKATVEATMNKTAIEKASAVADRAIHTKAMSEAQTKLDIAKQAQKRSEKAEAEKEAAQAKRRAKIERLLGRSGIKKRFQQRTFTNFIRDTPERRRCYDTAKTYADSFPQRAERGEGLYIEGTYGTGKTHLAAAIALQLIGCGVPVVCKTSGDLLADIKEAFDSGDATEYEILKAYKTVDLLIVDDLGKEQCTEWSVSTLYSILNDRYEDMKPTIITTNYNADELVRALTPKGGDGTKARAIISRLREVSTVITMAWADYRAGGGRRNA